ncbi:MAG: protein kinase, partial [Candidatus Hydrogenedentes bacterium]|nr:protein kinase [Candidatus Hydrogenedentota bacterium]
LLDFGLAKLTNVQSAFTMIGVSLGKQDYMAPEQRLSAAGVDKRADIYSLGVLFYQLVSGELPKLNTRLTDLVSDLPKEANDFVEKAMAQSADERYQDAREFRLALAHIYKLATGISIPGTSEADLPEMKVQFSEPTPTPETADYAPGGAKRRGVWSRLLHALTRFIPFRRR